VVLVNGTTAERAGRAASQAIGGVIRGVHLVFTFALSRFKSAGKT
jgi:hypothetical protein